MLWKSNTINCEVFSILQCHPTPISPPKSPSPLVPTQTTLAASPSGLQLALVLFFCYFPPRLHCTSTDFLSYPPIYFPLIFSTSLLYSQALSICTLFFLPFMVHPFIHNLPAKFTLFPILCTTLLLACTRALKHACRHSHK